MYRLYYSPGACSLIVHIALEEIGRPYEKELVWTDPTKDGLKTASEAWRKINPKGYVPALGGVAGHNGGADNLLTEAPAILLFLARTYPEAGLLPDDPTGAARAFEWLNYISGTVHGGAFAQIWRPERFVEHAADYPVVVAGGHHKLKKHFAYIEGLLGDGRDWAVPGHYTVADSYLLAIYRWAVRNKFDVGPHPAWDKHTARIMERPAVKRVFADEGISLT